MEEEYDVIVVGAGHAGCEAAAAAANMGSKVLLITMDMTKMAGMSCNPAMGGIAKGQIIREIDALGGYSGIVTDKSMIQFRMLNKSKGPALWSPRAQCDRMKFSRIWRKTLEETENIDFWQDTVKGILVQRKAVRGIRTRMGMEFRSKAVILTNGTFLNGLMHVGEKKIPGGRAGERPSEGLTEQLMKLGFEAGRMKTGTPARIDGRTVDFSKLTEQKGDHEGEKFSFLDYEVDYGNHKSCYIVYTNEEVHEELRKGLDRSPLYDGTIKSIGPRYCPSIETKIVTFPEKDRHMLFVEPEGENTIEYYINGFSSSLPWEIQYKALRKIDGMKNAKMFRPGYAIEYDYFPPVQLKRSMETKIIEDLYFAGQINGTTGYEEAGGQGIMAGINAHLKIKGEGEFSLTREQAYIGVLIDDLVTKGVDEPYRMFTSRAEFRLLLRQDDADERLSGISHAIGLAGKERVQLVNEKMKARDEMIHWLKKESIQPEAINEVLDALGTSRIKQKVKAIDLLLRPQINFYHLIPYSKPIKGIVDSLGSRKLEIIRSVEIKVKYAGYIEREEALVHKMKRLEKINIPEKLDYNKISSISTEARQKLKRIKPATLGQAGRISGVSPADINMILIFLGR